MGPPFFPFPHVPGGRFIFSVMYRFPYTASYTTASRSSSSSRASPTRSRSYRDKLAFPSPTTT